MGKLDFLTKLLTRKGMSLNEAITFKNIFASFMALVLALYIAFGYIALRAVEKTAPEDTSAASAQDEETMDKRIEPLQQEAAPQQEAPSFRSIARKAGTFMLWFMFFVILAATCFFLYEANILWLFLLLYGIICFFISFREFDSGSGWFRILIGAGIAMMTSGGIIAIPQRRREKLEKELSSKSKGGKKGSGGNRFIL